MLPELRRCFPLSEKSFVMTTNIFVAATDIFGTDENCFVAAERFFVTDENNLVMAERIFVIVQEIFGMPLVYFSDIKICFGIVYNTFVMKLSLIHISEPTRRTPISY